MRHACTPVAEEYPVAGRWMATCPQCYEPGEAIGHGSSEDEAVSQWYASREEAVEWEAIDRGVDDLRDREMGL